MWFIQAMGHFENGVQLPIITDLSENYLYCTAFFNHFSNASIFTVYDLILDREDILNVISKKEEKEIPFPTA